MKRICLGTMITLIFQSRIRRSDTYKSVCGGIFAAYGKKIENYNKELPGHLRSGHDTVPDDLVTAARTMPMDNIDKGVEEYVLPMINHEKKVALFRAIKAVLREDSFTDGALIGRIKGYEKENILNHNSFYDSMLLANVLTYAIASIDNDACAANIGEIDKDYVDGFLTSGEDIHFISKLINQDEVCPLKRTLKSPAFDRLFLKATDVTITGMTNPARACVYYLDPTDGHQVVGWVQTPEGWRYFDVNNGRMLVKVTALLDNVNCTFDKNGILVDPAGWTPGTPAPAPAPEAAPAG